MFEPSGSQREGARECSAPLNGPGGLPLALRLREGSGPKQCSDDGVYKYSSAEQANHLLKPEK